MDEYIKREEAIELIRLNYCKDCNSYNGARCRACSFDDAMLAIEDVPAADVVEVRHGEWIEEEKEVEFYGCIDKQTFYKCSLCGRYEEKYEPYCHCGAKMD